MGRIAYAEEHLQEYLSLLDVYSVGLILGQSTEQKDYVVHLARTLPASNNKVVEENLIKTTHAVQNTAKSEIKSISDVDVNLVADHAKHVTRMLPGGMQILGIFIVSPDNCFSENSCIQKLRSVLSGIHKTLALNDYLFGNSNHEHLILNFNTSTKQYICKSVETSTGGILKPADWKFQKKVTKWHHLESTLDLDYLIPILDEIHPHTLKRQLQEVIKIISDMVKTALIIIEGEPRSPKDLLEAIIRKKKNEKHNEEEKEKVLHFGVYLPCDLNIDKENVRITSCGASMRLVGQLTSRTAVYQKASIEEATNAIKQDILRSLYSRLELHWDSIIEDENGSPEENVTLHEPPRRVFVELPHNKVMLSDYLFPGEGPQESLIVLKELLDLDVQENEIQKDAEQQVDPSNPLLFSQSEVKATPVEPGKETATSNQFTLYVVGVIALVIAFVGILLHWLNSQ
ncbi:protein odr-4 homolog [Copidosoma floridanum]|uniref:protein odr-4 homolog n=1 Tax=Copidosoma floridanum TaxID=29053 RepID=UPI0006C97282|nr:protein odr-4 homolog [Copidosoma floridanum]